MLYKEVLRHLRNIVFDKRVANKWSKYLPLVQRIINASVNSSTGVAPADVVFPNGAKLDKELISEVNPVYMSSYIADMQRAQARIIALCKENLQDKDAQHMAKVPKAQTVFEKGAYVLAEHRANMLRRGPKSKLLPFLRGPMLVKSRNDKDIYVVQDLVSQRLYDYHVSRLRHFEYDPATLKPISVAVTDIPDEFVVEDCLAIRGNLRGAKSQIEFKIRWAGYGPADDTWEPWACVRDNEKVQAFLYHNDNPRIRKLTPKSYVPLEERGAEDPDEDQLVSEEALIEEEDELELESAFKFKDLKDQTTKQGLELVHSLDPSKAATMAKAAHLVIS